MYFKKINYENDMEILVTAANLVTFSGTVLSSGVAENEEGKKIAVAGTLIDANGNVVTAVGDALTGTPVGLIYKTIDVTNGDQPCALVVEGYIREDRVLDGYSDAAKIAVKEALPNIKFR
ncbi:hypothetical protein [Clostridium tertium]|uniref:hypothetical protein n=1 Tax=Clostridium tertium TaxID=1559 RepID=UPI0024B33F12|nr:hypothetical protein [Clostridium tertium]MDI9215951.1 hypothetical protein [Clostridium tertium]